MRYDVMTSVPDFSRPRGYALTPPGDSVPFPKYSELLFARVWSRMSSTNLFDFYEICFFEMPLVFFPSFFFFFFYLSSWECHSWDSWYVCGRYGHYAICRSHSKSYVIMWSLISSSFFFFSLGLGALWGSWLGLALTNSFPFIKAASPAQS